MTTVAERNLNLVRTTPSRALRYLPATALGVDLAVTVAASFVAAWVRSEHGFFHDGTHAHGLLVSGPWILAVWLGSLMILGAHRRDIFGAGTDEYKRVLNSSLLAAGLVGVTCFLVKFQLSRGYFLLTFGLGIPLLMLGRFAMRRAVRRAHHKGLLLQRVIIAGTPSHIDEVASVLRRETWLGYEVVGAAVPYLDRAPAKTGFSVPVLGTTSGLRDIVERTGVDVVFVAGGALESASEMRNLVWELEDQSVQIVVAPSVTDVSGERIRVRPVGGLPLMHIAPPTWADAGRIGKRTFDLVGSVLLLMVFMPLLLGIALAIKLSDGGPVLFRQTRVGRHGVEFSCLKFRTMVVNAEDLLAELHAVQGYTTGLFKMKDDPRITRLGKVMRRLSVDELPQIFNVLLGDMSLVGPRPPLPREVADYRGPTARRLHVRPGVTGLWQVSGRSDLSWDEAIRLDLYYVDNWSMLADLHILMKTFGAVFGSRGAY